jgi:hypothetical protein
MVAHERAEALLNQVERGAARHRLDAPDARCRRLFARDDERADVGGLGDVRAPAQLVTEHLGVADADGADDLAVLLAEQRHRALSNRLLARQVLNLHGIVREDGLVHRAGHDRDLLLRQHPVMREVEAQPVGRDERTRLPDVVAEEIAQLGVKQVGGGVVAHDVPAPLVVHRGSRDVALLGRATVTAPGGR